MASCTDTLSSSTCSSMGYSSCQQTVYQAGCAYTCSYLYNSGPCGSSRGSSCSDSISCSSYKSSSYCSQTYYESMCAVTCGSIGYGPCIPSSSPTANTPTSSPSTPTPAGDIIGIIVISVCLIIFYFLFRHCVKVVRHSEVMIIERFGSYYKTLTPGIHWIWPIIDLPRMINWKYTTVYGGGLMAVQQVFGVCPQPHSPSYVEHLT
jgi:hypothetical protein